MTTMPPPSNNPNANFSPVMGPYAFLIAAENDQKESDLIYMATLKEITPPELQTKPHPHPKNKDEPQNLAKMMVMKALSEILEQSTGSTVSSEGIATSSKSSEDPTSSSSPSQSELLEAEASVSVSLSRVEHKIDLSEAANFNDTMEIDKSITDAVDKNAFKLSSNIFLNPAILIAQLEAVSKKLAQTDGKDVSNIVHLVQQITQLLQEMTKGGSQEGSVPSDAEMAGMLGALTEATNKLQEQIAIAAANKEKSQIEVDQALMVQAENAYKQAEQRANQGSQAPVSSSNQSGPSDQEITAMLAAVSNIAEIIFDCQDKQLKLLLTDAPLLLNKKDSGKVSVIVQMIQLIKNTEKQTETFHKNENFEKEKLLQMQELLQQMKALFIDPNIQLQNENLTFMLNNHSHAV